MFSNTIKNYSVQSKKKILQILFGAIYNGVDIIKRMAKKQFDSLTSIGCCFFLR